jgi:hypothetical protein
LEVFVSFVDGPSLLVAFAALVVSAITLWRQWFYFRGTEIRLANNNDGQDCVVLPYAEHPQLTRDVFPNYEGDMQCALVKLVLLNTGDRTGYAHIRKITANSSTGHMYEVARHGYVDVPAASAAIHPILIWNLPDPPYAIVSLQIEYDWPWITRTGSTRKIASSELDVKLIPPRRHRSL